jgi:proteasome lid subunit RPN8/RPN11
MKLTEKLIEAMKRHAEEVYPEEACGIITDKKRYVKIQNIAENPKEDFQMPGDVMAKYTVAAIFHSHPDASDAPSENDMAVQIATDVPWALCSVRDGVASEPYLWGGDIAVPLTGREFRHGPSGTDNKGDCYALVRDWYRQERGIELPEYPRSDGWWEKGGDMYAELFKDAGFEETSDEPKPGDIAFMAIGATVENHAAVYVGDGMILHHLHGRFSRTEPAGRWRKMIRRWVRYAG